MGKNPFPFSDDNRRYHAYSYALKHRYGGRVARVPLDGGFTCPNRDGTKGAGGCAFCSGRGSGDQIPDGLTGLAAQYAAGIETLKKWPDARYIPYFQSFSGTYAPVSRLRTLYDGALALPGAVGLAVATRADCVTEEIADLLAEYAVRTDLTVELGLQTARDDTNAALNRCETFAEFSAGFARLKARGIPVWVHLINGLPGETRADMVDSARTVAALGADGVKLHALHVLRGTPLAAHPPVFQTMEDYVQTVCDQLEVLPPRTVIGRLTGDGPADALLGPGWTRRKRAVLNAIDRELARRNSWQGRKWTENG